MPIITKPADAVAELVQYRTRNSKRFDLGNGFHRIIHRLGRVHYQDDAAQWQDIETDLTTEAGTGNTVASSLPFRFRKLNTGIGYIFQDRDGGTVRVELRRVGNTAIDTNAVFTPTRNANRLVYADVALDTDIIFQVNRGSIQVFRRLKSANAAKAWRWAITYDAQGQSMIGQTMQGRDNSGRRLDGQSASSLTLSNGQPSDNGNGTFTYLANETWDGTVITVDPQTRQKSFTPDPQYPVLIDPDVTVHVTSAKEDCDATSVVNAYQSYLYPGWRYGHNYVAGWRFAVSGIAQGASISLAVLKVRQATQFGTPSSPLLVYGSKVGDSTDWTPYTSLYAPQGITKTTYGTPFSPANGIQSISVTAQVQEIVNLAGWASGNHMSFSMIPVASGSNFTVVIEAYDFSGGTNEAVLEITLAAATFPGDDEGCVLYCPQWTA